MLLHVDDRAAEIADRAELAGLAGLLHHIAELRLGAPLRDRASEKAGREDRHGGSDTEPTRPDVRHGGTSRARP